MNILFSKMHGLGNDFMVIDGVTQRVMISAERIRKLSDRHTGVGFDQLLLIEPPHHPDVDFHYRIFNADGQEVQQCGNGARCCAHFLHLKRLTFKKQISVSTCNGRLMLEVERNNRIRVNMGQPIFTPAQVPFQAQKEEKTYLLRIAEQTLFCGVVSMGNPHVVTTVDHLRTTDVAHLGKQLENHPRFPERVNAGFMQILQRDKIDLRVYERGVGETRACGSGACAAVAVGIMQGALDNKVQVTLTGGKLDIEWQGPSHPLWMVGDAKHVFDGKIRW